MELAGVSIVASCDAMRRLADIWRKAFPETPMLVIDVPRRTSARAHKYLLSQYETYCEWLEAISGRRAGESELREAISLVNRKRKILRSLAGERRKEPPAVSGSEFYNAVYEASRSPYHEFFEKYRSFDSGSLHYGPRLVITGSIIESTRIYDTIEAAGAHVVAEDTCTGLRSIEDDVEEGSAREPMESIAWRYLRRPPCSRMSDIEARSAYIRRLVSEYKAQGVVYHCLKFCDQYQYDYPLLKNRLEADGIPVLRIETDYQEGDSGQLSTRIEAFLELLATGLQKTPQ